MIGKCVQIGLNTKAEYLPLIYTDWKSACNRSDLEMLPDLFPDIEEWRYYGIDTSPQSISYLAKKFDGIPNISWICAHVTGNCPDPMVEGSFDDGQSEFSVESTWAATMKLDDFFAKIGGCDVLVMDIEGDEYEVVFDSSWQHKPKFMLIEPHGTDGGNGDVGSDRGYPEQANSLLSHLRLMGYDVSLVNVNPEDEKQIFVEARLNGLKSVRSEVPLDETP